MTTSIKHDETQSRRRVPFYDDELLRGVPSPWMIDESDRNIVAHFTFGNSDWFVAFYNSLHNVAYGFVRLDGDAHTSEWGEIDMGWLESMNFKQDVWIGGRSVELTIPVERDPNWEVRSFGELRKVPEYSWINESPAVSPLR